MSQTPTLGRSVHYKVSQQDADQINRRRADAARNAKSRAADGAQVHVGNEVLEGDVFPATIVRVFPVGSVNLQVQLDGNDLLWATSRSEGEGVNHWQWPPRVG